MHNNRDDNTKKTIAAVGSALIDICLQEDDEFVVRSGSPKGGMTMTGAAEIQVMLGRSENRPVIVPGGSACNTILGIGMLGNPARFIGRRGDDVYGSLFEDGVRAHHVEPLLQVSGTPTGHVLSVITPDAQRTMYTYLGASSELNPADITASLFTDTALVHLEGYLLFNHDLMMATLRAAKDAGALVSLDLASFTVVETARALLDEICDGYVDILIANEDEARVFTGFSDENTAIGSLSRGMRYAVLKLGRRGSMIAHDGRVVRVNPMGEGHAVDTTGAGDLWASGFLYGIINGLPLDRCGAIGSACGYEVCQVIGAQIPAEGWERIKKII